MKDIIPHLSILPSPYSFSPPQLFPLKFVSFPLPAVFLKAPSPSVLPPLSHSPGDFITPFIDLHQLGDNRQRKIHTPPFLIPDSIKTPVIQRRLVPQLITTFSSLIHRNRVTVEGWLRVQGVVGALRVNANANSSS